jgi:hypothetical protein
MVKMSSSPAPNRSSSENADPGARRWIGCAGCAWLTAHLLTEDRSRSNLGRGRVRGVTPAATLKLYHTPDGRELDGIDDEVT